MLVRRDPQGTMKFRSMKQVSTSIEKAAITFAAAIYLAIFNATLPHGDALRIVRQIESADLIWNPNHLLFDPLGYGFYRLLRRMLPGVTPLGCFEFLSAIATLVSLLIFHSIVVRAGVERPSVRVLAVAGLFASASFLAPAVSQYYFMVQMPMLLGALYLYIDFLLKSRAGTTASANLYWIGILLALATSVMFNNLLLVLAAGIAVGFVHESWRWEFRNTARLYTTAALVGFPVFIAGYMLSDTTSNLIAWLLSYEGNAETNLNQFYGAKWTVSRLMQGATLTGFNLAVGSMVEGAGLGTVLSVLAFGNEFEFIPQWGKILLSLLAIPAVIAVNVSVAYFALRRVPSEPAIRFLTIWILAFAVFNFLWNVGDEIFWMQILPAVWLLILLSQGAMSEPILGRRGSTSLWTPGQWRWNALCVLVVLLLVVNTSNAIVPMAARDFHDKQSQHTAMLRDGDLEVFPGWDQQKWIMLGDGAPNVQRLVLMNMAVAGMGSGQEIQRLPEIVESHLRRGSRVIVARVFDLDEDLMPWYGLRDTGWPRARIQSLLAQFCNRKLEQIGSVVFRELYLCEREAREYAID
jgi:hypothetical protein